MLSEIMVLLSFKSSSSASVSALNINGKLAAYAEYIRSESKKLLQQ